MQGDPSAGPEGPGSELDRPGSPPDRCLCPRSSWLPRCASCVPILSCPVPSIWRVEGNKFICFSECLHDHCNVY